MNARRGFVLVASLWAIVAAGALTMATSGVARDGVTRARNRVNHGRGYWLALGCSEMARDAIHSALWPSDDTPIGYTRAVWNALDRFVAPDLREGCSLNLSPAGVKANVNALTAAQLRALVRRSSVPAERVDGLTDALLDWRDEDDIPRENGAEFGWYVKRGLIPPRNGDLRAEQELLAVRGFADAPQVAALLGIERERILWTRAPRAVLATIPGMGDEALAAMEARGRSSLAGLSFIATLPELSQSARDSIARAAAVIATMTVSEPEAWITTVSVASGSPPMRVTVRSRMAIGDRRIIVIGRELLP